MTDAEKVAQAFHEAYERLAPGFGYKTREASAVPWEDVPANNKALMVAVVAALCDAGLLLPQDAETEHAQFDNGRFYMYANPGSRRVTHTRSVGPWVPVDRETENG
jgi:hypothetical protein